MKEIEQQTEYSGYCPKCKTYCKIPDTIKEPEKCATYCPKCSKRLKLCYESLEATIKALHLHESEIETNPATIK